MPRALTLAALLVLASASAAWQAPDWTLSLEERLLADDNIMRLSPSDQRRMEDDPGFQTDAEGPAALKAEHRVGVELDWRLRSRSGPMAALQKLVGGRAGSGRAVFSWDGKWTQTEGSSAGSYASHRVSASWQPRPGWGAEFTWRCLDNFYLRQFQDRDTGRDRGATFDFDQLELQLKTRAGDLGPWFRHPGFTFALAMDRESYNPWFTEYDTGSWSFALDLGWRMPAGFSAGAGWRFSETDNVGFTGSQGTGTVNLGIDSEGGDGGHQEDQYSVDLGWSGRLGTRSAGLNAGLALRDRYYQSRLGELQDPYHYGRHDRRWQAGVRGRLEMGGQLTLIPVLEREWRISEAAWAGISRVKDYRVLRLGLGLRWRLESN